MNAIFIFVSLFIVVDHIFVFGGANKDMFHKIPY
jgi:hypothetical protein